MTLMNLVGTTNPQRGRAGARSIFAAPTNRASHGPGPERTFDEDYLKALHRHLFQDVFEWAGQFRNEQFKLSDGTIAHAPAMRKMGSAHGFAIGNQISLELRALMRQLKENDNLKHRDRVEFASAAAHFFARLNWIHPFREGNGRTQRAFMAA